MFVYFVVKGCVFDVICGWNFYGFGGFYVNFVGCDVFCGLVKGSFDEDMLIKDLDGLLDIFIDLN